LTAERTEIREKIGDGMKALLAVIALALAACASVPEPFESRRDCDAYCQFTFDRCEAAGRDECGDRFVDCLRVCSG
jgi:hypothetical protein